MAGAAVVVTTVRGGSAAVVVAGVVPDVLVQPARISIPQIIPARRITIVSLTTISTHFFSGYFRLLKLFGLVTADYWRPWREHLHLCRVDSAEKPLRLRPV